MKFCLIPQLLLLTAAAEAAFAQATFTQITTGSIVNDGGFSFSCAWGDYDNDGYIDLVVGNGLSTPNFLYRNNRNGTFTKIITGPVVEDLADSNGMAWGDYDNDGYLDLFIVNWETPPNDFLYRNNGDGTFARITTGGILLDSSKGDNAAWGDYDRDGWLDLFVANTGALQSDFLYHGNGNGTFSAVTTGPIATAGGASTGCAWSDLDGDGDLDLFVANYINPDSSGQNDFLFWNDGAGNFARITSGPVVTDGAKGSNNHAVADYDNDGDSDLFVCNGENENNRLYRNDGQGNFTLVTNVISMDGLNDDGGAWGDYDNDGWLDLFVSTSTEGVPNRLYRNLGNGDFEVVDDGEIAAASGVSTGGAWGDYDNDGFLDLFIAAASFDGANFTEHDNFLYHNNGNSNHWLLVKLVGGVSNRSAIGAKVLLKATIGGKTFWQLREISGGGARGQNDLRAPFGLGDATNATVLRIEWPSGIVQEFQNVGAKQILIIAEPPVLKALGPGRVQVLGAKDVFYYIEVSDDLSTWTDCRCGEMTGGTVWMDPEAGQRAARFYRARQKSQPTTPGSSSATVR